MLNKFYEQGKDLHVANYIVYGKTADHKLYADKALKETVTEAEIKEAFTKGRLLIVEGTNSFAPIAYTNAGVQTYDATGGKVQAWTASAAE